MSGATLQQVADRLGYSSRQAVWKATTSLLERQEQSVSEEWRAFQVARLERLLVAVWQNALDGDDRAGQQALKIVQEIGKSTGVSRQRRDEASHPGPTMEPRPVFANMSDAEWLRRYEIARTKVLAMPPDGTGDAVATGSARAGYPQQGDTARPQARGLPAARAIAAFATPELARRPGRSDMPSATADPAS